MTITMEQTNTPGKFVRRFYLLTAAFVAAALSAICSVLLMPLPRERTASGFFSALLMLFFFGTLVGHKLRNYLWPNIVGATCLLTMFLVSNDQRVFGFYGFWEAAAIFAGAAINSRAMVGLKTKLPF